MVYLNYKLKPEKTLTQTQDGQKSPALPLGFAVECVGTDNEQLDVHRKYVLRTSIIYERPV